MTPGKRGLDLILAALLLPIVAVMVAVISVVLLICEGRPVFFLSERMKSPDVGFTLIKFRTMRVARNRRGVTGADKAQAITPVGAFLRKFRLDELPQLWNVLRGDVSFVGPRPPLREYVAAEPELYKAVLTCRPGITGLATLHFQAHESYILKQCLTADETHSAYLRRCVPRKATLDLIYKDNVSVCFDIAILVRTFWSIIRG